MLLHTKKEGVGGSGSDPLIITQPSPVTSHSLASGRQSSPPTAGLTVNGTDLSPVTGSANWEQGRQWQINEYCMSNAVK